MFSGMFDSIFRFNPAFTLTEVEDLDEDVLDRFRPLIRMKDIYGFLHAPAEAKLTVKVVNRHFAAFLKEIHEPRRMRDVFVDYRQGTDDEKVKLLIRLVLDSVLEVQKDGKFVSGPDAVNQVLLRSDSRGCFFDDEKEKNPVQIVSEKALYCAMHSVLDHPQELSFYLYNFNRIPLSLKWNERFPDETSIAQYLDLEESGSWKGMPDRVTPQPIRRDQRGEPNQFDLYWRSWRLKKEKLSKSVPRYKVYISPVPDDLPKAFRIVRDHVSDSEAHAMKVGRTLSGMLRSDKFIVYFREVTPAFEFASEMSEKLHSCRSYGVPFSYQVNPDVPVVSMGVDPPPVLGEKNSWRLYIANRLALAIQGAKRMKEKDPKTYIQTYMDMLGIDCRKWRPHDRDWRIDFK
jgi:hypothetical protein